MAVVLPVYTPKLQNASYVQINTYNQIKVERGSTKSGEL